MNLEPNTAKKGADGNHIAMWVTAVATLLVAVVYLAWTCLSQDYDAVQARLHPGPVLSIIASQVAEAAPPWEWNVPVWSITVWALWLAGVWVCGWACVCVVLRSSPVAVRAVLGFVVGFVLFGWLQMIFGMAGAARFPLIPVFTVFAGFLLWRGAALRGDIAAFGKALRWQWGQSGVAGRVVILMLMMAVFVMLPPALTPPAQSDGMRYHLGAPQEFLKNGSMDYLPGNAYSNMPFLVEMHFMAGLTMGGPEASHLMHLTVALFAAMGIYGVGRLLWGGGRLSLTFGPALLYLTAPMSAIVATWPYTDHGMSLMLVGSVAAGMLCIRAPNRWSLWLVLGICLGGLIGTKYTMAPVAVLIFGLSVAAAFWRREAAVADSMATRAALWAGAAATIIGGIWFLRNWLFIGNPVYPFGTGIFPGGEWGPVNDAFLQQRAGAKGFGKGVVDLIRVPFTSTFRWTQFEGHNPGTVVLLALLFAVAGIVALFGRMRDGAPGRREMLFLMCIAAGSALTWFFSYQGNRLLLPSIALGLALLPVGWFAVRSVAAQVFTGAVLLCASSGLFWAMQWSWVATELTPPPLPYLLGQQDEKAFFYRSVSYGRAFDYLNERVEQDERVLLIGEHRIYGAEFNAIWSDWFDTPALVRYLREQEISSTDELLEQLRADKISWILINEAELAPQLERDFRPWFQPDEWRIFEELGKLSREDVRVINLPPGVRLIHLEPGS